MLGTHGQAKGEKDWGWVGQGRVVEGKWRQLYLNNNKKRKKFIILNRTSRQLLNDSYDFDLFYGIAYSLLILNVFWLLKLLCFFLLFHNLFFHMNIQSHFR